MSYFQSENYAVLFKLCFDQKKDIMYGVRQGTLEHTIEWTIPVLRKNPFL